MTNVDVTLYVTLQGLLCMCHWRNDEVTGPVNRITSDWLIHGSRESCLLMTYLFIKFWVTLLMTDSTIVFGVFSWQWPKRRSRINNEIHRESVHELTILRVADNLNGNPQEVSPFTVIVMGKFCSNRYTSILIMVKDWSIILNQRSCNIAQMSLRSSHPKVMATLLHALIFRFPNVL